MHEERIEAVISSYFSNLDNSIDRLIENEFSKSEIQNLTPQQIAEGLKNYLKKQSKISAQIFTRQELIESQFINLLNQFVLLSDSVESTKKLKQSIDQLRTEYNASIGSIKVSVDSVKNSADVLSSSVTRIDQNIGRLATNDSVKSIVFEAEKNLASKHDLDKISNEINSTKSDIENKINKVESHSNWQFGILIATLFLGFLAIAVPLFFMLYQSIQNTPKTNNLSSIEKQIKSKTISLIYSGIN